MSQVKNRRRPSVKRIEIIPPEGIPLRFDIATVGERISALIVDLVILILTIVVVALLFIWTLKFSFSSASWIAFNSSLFILTLFFLRQGYFFFFELRWQGTTPGKRFAKVRVIARDGGSLTLSSIIARNLFRDIELFLPLSMLLSPGRIHSFPVWVSIPMFGWLLVMLAMPFLNAHRLRLGDLVGGTMVVRLPKAELLPDKAAQKAHIQTHIAFEARHLTTYGVYELETLASILQNVEDGKADVVDLRIIANTIAHKIEFQGSEPREQPELFLRSFYRQQRAHLEKNLLLGQHKANKHA